MHVILKKIVLGSYRFYKSFNIPQKYNKHANNKCLKSKTIDIYKSAICVDKV
jgi:hypothetical protein